MCNQWALLIGTHRIIILKNRLCLVHQSPCTGTKWSQHRLNGLRIQNYTDLIWNCVSPYFSWFYCTQDSLLAAPIILDLIIIGELCERISMKVEGGEFESFHPVLSVLSYLLKAPMVPQGTPVVNALFRQKLCLENIFR